MELQKMCKDHLVDLDQLIETSFNLIDNSMSDFQTPLSDYYDRVMSLKEEDELNLEDLRCKIKELQNTQETTRQQLVSLEKRIELLKKEKENLQEQKALKKKSLLRVKKQHDSMQNSVLKLEKQLSKDTESQNILDRNKKELLLYKQITGVSWDFAAPPGLVKGFITNKETCFLKPFCFDKEKMSSQQIAEALWELISSSSLQHSQES